MKKHCLQTLKAFVGKLGFRILHGRREYYMFSVTNVALK